MKECLWKGWDIRLSKNSKWLRTGIAKETCKDLLYMYGTTYKKVRFSEGEKRLVELRQIIPETQDWKDTVWIYDGLMGRIDRGCTEYTDSAWWKHETRNETKNIQGRLNKFKELYASIKKRGFQSRTRLPVILLDVSKVKRKNPPKGGRISYKYYRINGMKRVLACNYLGINKIPCKIFHVSLG